MENDMNREERKAARPKRLYYGEINANRTIENSILYTHMYLYLSYDPIIEVDAILLTSG